MLTSVRTSIGYLKRCHIQNNSAAGSARVYGVHLGVNQVCGYGVQTRQAFYRLDSLIPAVEFQQRMKTPKVLVAALNAHTVAVCGDIYCAVHFFNVNFKIIKSYTWSIWNGRLLQCIISWRRRAAPAK